MRFLCWWFGLFLWTCGATAGVAQGAIATSQAASAPIPAAAAVAAPGPPPTAAPGADLARPAAAASRLAGVPSTSIALSAQSPLVSLSDHSRAWIDPTGFRSVDQVEAASNSLPWSTLKRGRQYDLDDKALWIVFDAAQAGDAHFYLEVASSTVSKAELYYRGQDGHWVRQDAGSTMAVSDWPLPGRYPTFELSPARGAPVRYWLRIEQDHIQFSAPIRLADASWLIGSRELGQFVFGAYFGLIGLIALGSLANAAVHRDRNFAVFTLYVGVLAIGQLAAYGLGQEYLWHAWPTWNRTAMFLLPGISSAVGVWFVRNITEPARFSRGLDLSVWSVIAAILSAAALDTVLASPSSFLLLMGVTLVGFLVVGGLIVLAWAKAEDPHIGLITVGVVPILVMGLLTVLAGLDVLPPSPATRDGLPLGAAIGMPLLFYALSLRTSHRREAEVRAAALARHDVLTGIAHDRTLLQRLQGAIERAQSLRQHCALMVLDLSNFDALASEFGRETADRALVVTASLLRRAATDIDLEARVGEHQFALMLEGPTTAENAMNRAQELVARGLRPSTAMPAAATIKFHIAVALLPHETYDAAASLRWLLEAVNAMPADARKLIRPMNF